MSIFWVLNLISKNHDIRVCTNVDDMLIPAAVVGSEIDSERLVGENLVIVKKELLAIPIIETTFRSCSYSA